MRLGNGRLWWAFPVLLALGGWCLPAGAQESREREERERAERREREERERAERREREGGGEVRELAAAVKQLREQMEMMQRQMREMQEGLRRDHGEHREGGESREIVHRLEQIAAQMRDLESVVRARPDSPQAVEAREALGALGKEREHLAQALRERRAEGEMEDKMQGLRGRLAELGAAYRKSANDREREELREQFEETARALLTLDKRSLAVRAEQLEKELRRVREELEGHDKKAEEHLKHLREEMLRGKR